MASLFMSLAQVLTQYYDGEAVFVYPDEGERLTLKEVPFMSGL